MLALSRTFGGELCHASLTQLLLSKHHGFHFGRYETLAYAERILLSTPIMSVYARI